MRLHSGVALAGSGLGRGPGRRRRSRSGWRLAGRRSRLGSGGRSRLDGLCSGHRPRIRRRSSGRLAKKQRQRKQGGGRHAHQGRSWLPRPPGSAGFTALGRSTSIDRERRPSSGPCLPERASDEALRRGTRDRQPAHLSAVRFD